MTSDSLLISRYTSPSPAAGEGRDGVMISSVKITNYRAFSHFVMRDLGKEGLYLLASGRNPAALWQIIARRGEQFTPEPNPTRGIQAEADVSHLFYAHEIADGSELTIATSNAEPGRSVTFRVDKAKPEENPQVFAQLSDEGVVGERLAFRISGTPDYVMPPIPISKADRLGPTHFNSMSR